MPVTFGRPHRYPFVPYRPDQYPEDEMIRRGREFRDFLGSRRSVRYFSEQPVPRACIDLAIECASTAPSGAHFQPWKFAVIGDPQIRHQIRVAAEEEERQNYEGGRLPPAWRAALERLETTSDKGYLDVVPWIVVCFAEKSTIMADGSRRKNYYVSESAGIACGFFIAAVHRMGLATPPTPPTRWDSSTTSATARPPSGPTSCSRSATPPPTPKCPTCSARP